jgi:hypothetical protein
MHLRYILIRKTTTIPQFSHLVHPFRPQLDPHQLQPETEPKRINAQYMQNLLVNRQSKNL